jgi:hypothetical protein
MVCTLPCPTPSLGGIDEFLFDLYSFGSVIKVLVFFFNKFFWFISLNFSIADTNWSYFGEKLVMSKECSRSLQLNSCCKFCTYCLS